MRERHGNTIGHRLSREYVSWYGAKTRCYNPRQAGYKNYGGRGIVMCDRWRDSFADFLADMGRCPEGYTLDRIDNSGPYSPENCRWASWKQQMNNSRWNRIIEYEGQSMTMAQWADAIGMHRDTLKRRILLGWPIHRALTEPLRHW